MRRAIRKRLQSETRLSVALPLLLLALLLVGVEVQAIDTIPDEKAEQAAKQDLSDLNQTLKDAAGQGGLEPSDLVKELVKILDIQFPEDVSHLPLEFGVPMREYRVDFYQLRRFQRGDDPAKLLLDMNRVTYPLILGRKVRSLLAVRSKDGKEWQTAGWGSPEFAKRLSKFRKLDTTRVRSSPATLPADFMVWVLELNLCFLGMVINGQFNLTSIGNLPIYQLEPGQSARAEDVFLRLQPEAKARREGIR